MYVLADEFVYDETSPSCLRWRTNGRVHRKAGDVAGSFNKSLGYWQVSLHKDGHQTTMYCHIIIWILHNGDIPTGYMVDHENISRKENKIVNLRLVTRKGNLRNASKSSRNTSGITGVFSNKTNWIANSVSLDGKHITKSFSIKKYGDAAAKEMAILAREAQINDLNSMGAGYSTLHGKITKEIL